MIVSTSEYKGLSYNMDTGEFYRFFKGGYRGKKTGIKIVKSFDCCNGYYRIYVNGKRYQAGRLAYMMVIGTKKLGDCHVDHINGDRSDNRWLNLRILSPRENSQNTKKARSGYLSGTTWCKEKRKFSAQIMHQKTRKTIGRFKTEYEAHCAYMNYMDKHNIPYLKEIDKRKDKDRC